ncbi:ferredoxin [Microbacterium sp.]|uniref:ferredoxin n=1 Tax=Microbacterium sp. TaxID=51671 RepID=UPI003A86B569
MAYGTIEIDQARCEGYGFCAESAPTLLELDDDGILHTLRDADGDAAVARAQAAVRVCPVAALKLRLDED